MAESLAQHTVSARCMISNTWHYLKHQNSVLAGNASIHKPPTPVSVSEGCMRSLSYALSPLAWLHFLLHTPLAPLRDRLPLIPAAPTGRPPPGPNLVKEAGDIVDSPVDHQPYILRGVALRHLLQTVIGDGGLHPLPLPIAASCFHSRHRAWNASSPPLTGFPLSSLRQTPSAALPGFRNQGPPPSVGFLKQPITPLNNSWVVFFSPMKRGLFQIPPTPHPFSGRRPGSRSN